MVQARSMGLLVMSLIRGCYYPDETKSGSDCIKTRKKRKENIAVHREINRLLWHSNSSSVCWSLHQQIKGSKTKKRS